MRRLLSVAALAAAVAAPAFAQTPTLTAPSGTYGLDRGHASILWKINHLGLSNYTARFTDFDATLMLNAEDITKSRVTATVTANSVETDYNGAEDFNGKLEEQAFKAAEFPTISFASTAVEQTGPNTGKVTGDLTMLGVTKPITLDVTFNGNLVPHPFAQVPAVGFTATGVITRSQWGVNNWLPNIGDAVELEIQAEFQRKGDL
jgi:polyisoprenoid-binding protein YceI